MRPSRRAALRAALLRWRDCGGVSLAAAPRILVAGSGLRRAPRIGSSHRRAAMTKYAGLDVSLEENGICIGEETGGIVREARVEKEVDAFEAYVRDLGVEQNGKA